MNDSIFEQLSQKLTQAGAPYGVMRHPPVYTSAEAAKVRGVSLSSGAKALICKADAEMVMIVMPANLRLASKSVRKNESLKSLRFANRGEVQTLTGLEPGAIPPFGSLFGLPTWCDQRLAEETTINFNAGDHAISIQMTFDAYSAYETPRMGRFAEPAPDDS